MGVPVPLVQMDVTPLPLPYSLGDTSAALDEARARWLDVAELLGHLAEIATAVWRLAAELQKTQRRVNALEDVLIPQYEATLQYIAGVLEEQERDAFVVAKRVKVAAPDDGQGRDRALTWSSIKCWCRPTGRRTRCRRRCSPIASRGSAARR